MSLSYIFSKQCQNYSLIQAKSNNVNHLAKELLSEKKGA